ncbi:MAG TPA: DUF4040 domain-containing protein [Trebonia sp.]|nr:DUF4040 domain-containing protein [Trebonia sp.]
MTVLLAAALTLVALAGTAVVATNLPERQAVSLSFLGLALTVLFVALQAPGVALSQLGVGTAIVPLMVMLAIRTINARHARQQAADQQDEQDGGPEDGQSGKSAGGAET